MAGVTNLLVLSSTNVLCLFSVGGHDDGQIFENGPYPNGWVPIANRNFLLSTFMHPPTRWFGTRSPGLE